MSDTFDVIAFTQNGVPLVQTNATFQLQLNDKVVLVEGENGTVWLNWDNLSSFGVYPHKDEDA